MWICVCSLRNDVVDVVLPDPFVLPMSKVAPCSSLEVLWSGFGLLRSSDLWWLMGLVRCVWIFSQIFPGGVCVSCGVWMSVFGCGWGAVRLACRWLRPVFFISRYPWSCGGMYSSFFVWFVAGRDVDVGALVRQGSCWNRSNPLRSSVLGFGGTSFCSFFSYSGEVYWSWVSAKPGGSFGEAHVFYSSFLLLTPSIFCCT